MSISERSLIETRALRMLRSGWARLDVARETGLSLPELVQLQRDFPSSVDNRCTETTCGRTQDGPGRPRKGWVQIKAAAQPAVWFCGWACAERHVLHQIRKASA